MRIRIQVLMAATVLASTLAFAQAGPGSPDPSQPEMMPQPEMDQQPGMDQQGGQEDPPSRAARLGFLQGTVSFQPGGVEDWVPATVNRPMTTGDRLWTEPGARAELSLGSASMRLNGKTNFTFLNLDDQTAQIQVSMGSLSVRLRRLDPQEVFEIDTPQVAFSLSQPGDYRVDVNEQGDATIVTVRGGEGEATGGGQAFTVHARDQVRVSMAEGSDQPVFDRRAIPPADSFDNWCMDRDRRDDMSQSARYVSREMPGYADLDQNGVWSEDPGLGPVWRPRGVAIGWAPYHYGHWAWIAPWGWTWVDDAPWGYAPFHYGRWAYVGGGWGWVPGPMAVRPVYAPALVAWVGGSSFGVGIGIGGPAVGWFPLGPREVFVPAYRYSPRYIERVNVTNTVIVNRGVFANANVSNMTYMNRGVAGAVTVVPQGAMMGGRPVGAAAVVVAPGVLARAEVRPYAGAAPERGAVFGGRAATTFAPPAAVTNRQFVARNTPPPPPTSFDRQQQQLRANPGRPLDMGQARQIQQNQPMQERRMIRAGGQGQQSGAGGFTPGGNGSGGNPNNTFGRGNPGGGNGPGGNNNPGGNPNSTFGRGNPGSGNGTGGGNPGGNNPGGNNRSFQGNPNFGNPNNGNPNNNQGNSQTPNGQQTNQQNNQNNGQQGPPRGPEFRRNNTGGTPPTGSSTPSSTTTTSQPTGTPSNSGHSETRRNDQKQQQKQAPRRDEKRDER